MANSIPYRMNPALNPSSLAKAFGRTGRLRIPKFLASDCAVALHTALDRRADWRQVVNSGERVFELDRATRRDMPPDTAQALDEAVYAGARSGFQYRYETIRVPDDEASRLASDDPLAAFAHWFSTGPARDLVRTVTGEAAIAFADAQATAYSPGDFLTAHDDDVPGKNRYAAYVLGMSPVWRCEWGGLLLFHGSAGAIEEGYAPEFNTLNLFRVPQLHSVSEVSRAAAYRRYSVTGWLRGEPA